MDIGMFMFFQIKIVSVYVNVVLQNMPYLAVAGRGRGSSLSHCADCGSGHNILYFRP